MRHVVAVEREALKSAFGFGSVPFVVVVSPFGVEVVKGDARAVNVAAAIEESLVVDF